MVFAVKNSLEVKAVVQNYAYTVRNAISRELAHGHLHGPCRWLCDSCSIYI